MSKSKYSTPTFPTISRVERGDTSRDISKMDRQMTGSPAGPSSGSKAYKTGPDLNAIDKALTRTSLSQNR